MILRRAFTLIELLISMALLIVAISIALFATIGTNSLIVRTDARSFLAENVRSTADELRRLSQNANVSEVILLPVGDPSYFGLEVKVYGATQQQNICQVIGRAVATTDANGNQTYALSTAGTLLAEWVYSLNAANTCQNSSSDTVLLYQGRLTSDKIVVKKFLLSLNNVDAVCATATPVPPSGCPSLKQVRYQINLETAQTLNGTGQTSEAAHPSIEVAGSLPIGLIQ